MEHQILRELNDRQKQAVQAPRQPLLLLAGPGTGKTRTLIARIAYEIYKYLIPPENILALTFSNKAANEIRSRLAETLKDKASKVRCGTFHSFCLDVLRKNYEVAGLHKHFSVCDESYQTRLLRGFVANRLRDNVEKKVKSILLAFSNYALKGKPLPPFSAIIYDEYTTHLHQHRLIDYDQILIKTLTLFQEHTDILNQYRFINQSVLVDEFQDTDPVQYQIIRLLAEKHRNIFAVADDDQSIYAWRGANPENIRRFMEDFMIEAPILLDRNYRCGPSIMDAAQEIVFSTQRVVADKKINSDPDRTAKVQALFFSDESQEIHFILKKIVDWRTNLQVGYADMAVLYPQHRIGDNLANYFLKARIPYQLANGRNLLDHAVMKKVLLYLKLIRDPADALILEELIESELGQHIYKQIQQIQTQKKITFRKALNELSSRSEISYKVRNQLSTFIGNVANLVNLKSFYSFDRLIEEIIRGIQNLNVSTLDEHVSKLESFTVKRQKSLSNPAVNIWIYHSDEKIAFIAGKMLEKVFGKRVHSIKPDNVLSINVNDFAILLEAFSAESLPCKYELLFRQTTDRRRGILSTLLRWIQIHLKAAQNIFNTYVIFDLETTGQDPEKCGIVEIAAVRVRDGQIVGEFHRLINPGMPIEAEAQSVHNISDAEVADQPQIDAVWPDFLSFIGNDIIVAHNGYSFDFKIIDRIARDLNLPKLNNTRYDSLILARNLYPNASNSIDGLIERFRLKTDARHRALDDVRVLHEIFSKMLEVLDEREIRTSGEELTEYVTLGNILENTLTAVEDKIFFIAGIRKLLSPYSAIRSLYAKKFLLNDEEMLGNFQRISQRIAPSTVLYDTNEDFFRRIMEMALDFKKLPVDQAIAEFLSFLSLVNPQDSLESIDAVSLLTFYSAKGLEFDRVIILGMEDEMMPSYFSKKMDEDDDRPVSQKLDEQKRLLYVGVTRGKSEVIFTVVKNRFGRQQKSSPFLDEIKSKIEIKTLTDP